MIDQIWFDHNWLIHKNVIPVISTNLETISNVIQNHLQAWKSSSFGQSIWQPPPIGSLKLNFDVATKEDFAIAAAILSNDKGEILLAFTNKLAFLDVNKGEATTTLTSVDLAISFGCYNLLLEGDSLVTFMAINQPVLLTNWSLAPIILYIQLKLQHFQAWNAEKVSRSAKSHAHHLAKWAATNLVFGSISNSSPIFFFIRINSGKDPPL